MSAVSPEAPFPHVGGRACLDFVNSIHGRTGDRPRERLRSYADLIEWCRVLGHLTERDAARLLSMAASDPVGAESVHGRALRLREAFFELFCAVADGREPDRSDLETVNSELARIAPNLCCLRWHDGGPTLDWSTALALDRPLWRVLRSAIDLLTSDDRRRIKLCEAESCSWLFVDETRNRSRRWCEMAICGNREKARRFRERRRRRRRATA